MEKISPQIPAEMTLVQGLREPSIGEALMQTSKAQVYGIQLST